MKKKSHLYYGTEENFYEIEKRETHEAAKDVKNYLVDVVDKDEADKVAAELERKLKADGIATYEGEDEHGYSVFLGIAEQGHCQTLRNILKEKRRECMELAGF